MEQFIEKYREIGKKLKPFIRDVSQILHDELRHGKKVLYEGAQGVMLDVDYGTYPYVTSSHTLPSQSALGLGARLPEDTLFIGILKAYSTRVGEGPFPTELNDAMGAKLRETGQEFGATTGRPRRCGWLDLVAVKYTLRISGIKNLALTKADVLCGLDELQVCTEYEVDGRRLDTIPADTSLLWRAKPVYQRLDGWKESLKGVKSASGIPPAMVKYIRFIEESTGAKINLISTGAAREAVIDIQKAF